MSEGPVTQDVGLGFVTASPQSLGVATKKNSQSGKDVGF